jgi:hypothetical protein
MKKGIIFLIAVTLCSCSPSDEDIESKIEWGDLQAISQKYSGESITKTEIVPWEGRYFLGIVSSQSNSVKIWVLLNPKSPPYYKQFPEGIYTMSKEEFEMVKTSNSASSTVLAVLFSHVSQ